jgi:hypothetical protein
VDDTLYCICRKVSHGEMIGCDNENCEIEWVSPVSLFPLLSSASSLFVFLFLLSEWISTCPRSTR